MKKFILILILILAIAIPSGCSKNSLPSEKTQTAEFFALDTYCSVTVYGENETDFKKISEDSVAKAQTLLTSSAENNLYIADIKNQTLNLSGDATDVLVKAFEIYDISDGAFDITIAPLTKLWDIANRTEPPSESEILFAKSFCGKDKITFSEDLRTVIFLQAGSGIDIGAVCKGYAGDTIAKALTEAGYTAGNINLGGNVTVFGKKQSDKPFVIGIKDPLSERNDSIVGTLVVTDCSVVTSGAYERFFTYEGKRYHHIIDPATGSPAVNDFLSVTVIAENGIYADALSTAIFAAGPEKAGQLIQSATEKGYMTGAVLINNERSVSVIGDLDFTVTNNDYHEN